MSSITNIPYSAKSMNGIIVLSDGTATIENGNMTTTGNITGTNFSGTTISATTLNTTDTNIYQFLLQLFTMVASYMRYLLPNDVS